MNKNNHNWHEFLIGRGVKSTKPRLQLAEILFSVPHFHFRAEDLFNRARNASEISLATVYNSLETFLSVGLLSEIKLHQYSIYDTNAEHHYHFLDENTGQLIDIPSNSISFSQLPNLPNGKSMGSMDLIIRIS